MKIEHNTLLLLLFYSTRKKQQHYAHDIFFIIFILWWTNCVLYSTEYGSEREAVNMLVFHGIYHGHAIKVRFIFVACHDFLWPSLNSSGGCKVLITRKTSKINPK
jgi:hypothetical protein